MRKTLLALLLVLPLAAPVAAMEADTPVTPDKSLIGRAQDMLDYALSLTGVRYRFGGSDPQTGLDCSGFVRHVFNQSAGLTLPHNALAISLLGDRVNQRELKPGDLVFFNTMRRAFTHVGIYLGDNRFVHAATRGGGVMISDLRERYWAQRFNGARRLPAPMSGAAFPE